MQRILAQGEIESIDHSAIPRCRLPVRQEVFRARAARLRRLAANQIGGIPVDPSLAAYLLLMAKVADAQHLVLNKTGGGAPLDDESAFTPSHAHSHGMPLFPASGRRPDTWRNVAARFFEALEQTGVFEKSMSPPLSALQARLRALQADPTALDAAADAVLAGRAVPDTATAPFIYAALQIEWTAQSSTLRERDVPVVDPAVVCPVCGTVPVASVVRIGAASQGYRYLQCGLCACEFHMVRVKCSTCESTGGIFYHGLIGREAFDDVAAQPGAAADAASVTPAISAAAGGILPRNRVVSDPAKFSKAESCDECHTYRKIFYQEHDYETEPLADDLASLALDMLMTDAGYERAGANPLLWLDEQS